MLFDQTPVARGKFPVLLWPRPAVLVDHPRSVLGVGNRLGHLVHQREKRVVVDHFVALGVVVAEVLCAVDPDPVGAEIHLAPLKFEQQCAHGWLFVVEMLTVHSGTLEERVGEQRNGPVIGVSQRDIEDDFDRFRERVTGQR